MCVVMISFAVLLCNVYIGPKGERFSPTFLFLEHQINILTQIEIVDIKIKFKNVDKINEAVKIKK